MLKIVFFFCSIVLSFFIYKIVIFKTKKKRNYLFVINIIFILSIILFIILFYLLSNSNIDSQYNSPMYNGEKIIPGFFSNNEK
jgi:predicted PurR-regulated permease PerM